MKDLSVQVEEAVMEVQYHIARAHTTLFAIRRRAHSVRGANELATEWRKIEAAAATVACLSEQWRRQIASEPTVADTEAEMETAAVRNIEFLQQLNNLGTNKKGGK